MIQALAVLAVPLILCAPPAGADATGQVQTHAELAVAPRATQADSVEAVYRSGQTWDEFYETVDRRRELWVRNWTNARVSDELATRARGVAGAWHFLIIAEPGCSDSANSVPYIVKLVRQTPGLEARLVNSTSGRPWMETYRSPDGRAATPTVLLLDEHFNIRGCWVEQPAALQRMWLPVVARGAMAEHVNEKLAWYERDAGRETLREIVEMMERADSGQPPVSGPCVAAAHSHTSADTAEAVALARRAAREPVVGGYVLAGAVSAPLAMASVVAVIGGHGPDPWMAAGPVLMLAMENRVSRSNLPLPSALEATLAGADSAYAAVFRRTYDETVRRRRRAAAGIGAIGAVMLGLLLLSQMPVGT